MFSFLFSKFDKLRGLMARNNNDCILDGIEKNGDRTRVQAVVAEHPNCKCEERKTSIYSPSPVGEGERLARFVFSPVHVNKSGKIKPSVFSHVYSVGCSVQREDVVGNDELVRFARGYLTSNETHEWFGVLIGNCGALRASMSDDAVRDFCIYDTAEPTNPAHAEIHAAKYEIPEADRVELRSKLFDAFGGGVHISPDKYRDGEILRELV